MKLRFPKAATAELRTEHTEFDVVAINRRKAKGRSSREPFLQLARSMVRSSQWSSLSAIAVKLLIDLYMQYNGFNNGSFAMTWDKMQEQGWRSKDTLYRARRELLDKGFIIQTRQGGKHKPSLYGVTFQAIDDCRGVLDCGPTQKASQDWARVAVGDRSAGSPNTVQNRYDNRTRKENSGTRSP